MGKNCAEEVLDSIASFLCTVPQVSLEYFLMQCAAEVRAIDSKS